MKKVVVLLAAVGLLVALSAYQNIVWSKGHVPVKKAQVCHKGRVIVVSESAIPGHVVHGDCQIPACDAVVMPMAGDDCSFTDEDPMDGKCDIADPMPVEGTAGCPAGAGKF